MGHEGVPGYEGLQVLQTNFVYALVSMFKTFITPPPTLEA
jgi:hypothetical protein